MPEPTVPHPSEIRTANHILDAIPVEMLWAVEGFWVNDMGNRMNVRTHEVEDHMGLNVRVIIDVSLPDLLSRITPRHSFQSMDLDGFNAYTITTSGAVRGSIVGALNLPPEGITRAPDALNGILRSLWDVLLSQEPLRRIFIDPYGQACRALGIA